MAWIDDLLLGQDPKKLKLSPEVDSARRRREALAGRLEAEAFGEGPTQGELAIREAGREAIETAGRQAASRAAGARGFSKVLADIAAGSETAQAAQEIAGQTERAAAQERDAARRGARQELASTLASQSDLAFREEELRRKLAKGGLLPGLLALGGAGIGGLVGGREGAALGAKLGGTVGGAFSRNPTAFASSGSGSGSGSK